ncbi:MAG: hypothetical protein AAGJ87_05365, partial [Pseudomonadota bacterium]
MSDTDVTHAAELSDASPRKRSPFARSIFGDIVQFADFVLVTAAAVAVAYVYHTQVLATEFDIQQYAAAGMVGATFLTALLRRDGFYEFDCLLAAGRSIPGVIARWSLMILGLIAFGFALKISENFSRAWLFTWAAATTSVLIVFRIGASAFLRRMVHEGGVFARRIAVIGATETAAR